MEESVEGSNKVTGNRQKLKEIFQKWQYVTIGAGKSQNNVQQQSDEHPEGIPPLVCWRLKISGAHCDSDEEHDCRSPEPAHGVPKGYLAVYVGPTLRRFIIPTSYLSDPLFKVLLEKVEEEFGFDHTGALTIPCEIETFKYLLQCMENHQKGNNIDVPAENNDASKSPERIENSERSESTETSLPAIDE